ncbi:G-patch domain-containing protein, partial [Dissophora ornata]
DSLQLPPMPKPLRRKIHLLCNHYNVKSQSVGSGKRRFPILVKTDRTKMPINPVNITKLLNPSEKELKELTRLSAQFQGTRKGGNGGGGNGAPHGTVVGASASAISGENLGHRMLTKMGWSPGVGLGAAGEGITQPIEAIVRAKRRGLGHE